MLSGALNSATCRRPLRHHHHHLLFRRPYFLLHLYLKNYAMLWQTKIQPSECFHFKHKLLTLRMPGSSNRRQPMYICRKRPRNTLSRQKFRADGSFIYHRCITLSKKRGASLLRLYQLCGVYYITPFWLISNYINLHLYHA